MLTSEIIQRVQSLYSKGIQSDDSRLSSRHIYNKLISLRSRLISQKVNKRQKISQWSYQTLPCIGLEKAPKNECPCIPPIGCEILKSKYPLPKSVTSIDKHIIQSVTSLDGSEVYNETFFEIEKYSKGNKYTKNNISYYIRNGYLYVTGTIGLEVITLTGIFEDPTEVINYKSYCEDDCEECCESVLDQDFPIDGDLIDVLVELSVKELIEVFSQMREDRNNNAGGDSGPQQQE